MAVLVSERNGQCLQCLCALEAGKPAGASLRALLINAAKGRVPLWVPSLSPQLTTCSLGKEILSQLSWDAQCLIPGRSWVSREGQERRQLLRLLASPALPRSAWPTLEGKCPLPSRSLPGMAVARLL